MILGINSIDQESFTAVGIGDRSGKVFGNGMLQQVLTTCILDTFVKKNLGGREFLAVFFRKADCTSNLISCFSKFILWISWIY